ncbi:MAG: hypothetical protein ACFFGZ_15525 [Candidatus Thorarchaeota archaeon]
MDKFVLIVTRDNGFPLADKSDQILMFENQVTEEQAVSLAAFLYHLENVSADLIPISTRFEVGKKPYYTLYGITEDPYSGQLGILVTNDSDPRGDPYKVTRLLSFRLLEFLERYDAEPLPSGRLGTDVTKKATMDFYRSLLYAFQDEISVKASSPENLDNLETVLCAAQLEDVKSLLSSRCFFVSLKQAGDILKDDISSQERTLLRSFGAVDKPISVALNFLEALLSNLGLSTKEKEKVRPNLIELRHRKDIQTRYRFRFFYPKKKYKEMKPAWMVVTTTNPLIVAASLIAGKVDKDFARSTVEAEDLQVRMLQLAFQPEFTEFENLVHYTLGPAAFSGIRGVIQLSDLFSIGTTEGSTAADGNAGAKQTQVDDSLQSRIFELLDDDRE